MMTITIPDKFYIVGWKKLDTLHIIITGEEAVG